MITYADSSVLIAWFHPEQTDELSAEQAAVVPAGNWDFFHVAAVLHARVACFATCDKLQAELANESGLAKVKLFKSCSIR